MLTFFTTAKPFAGHSGIIQRNALRSWKLLHPEVEVILFGDEEGVAEVCAELDLRHVPRVKRHESGMKYLDFMFREAQQTARHSILCYSNCDIVLLPDFLNALEKAQVWRDKFLMVARRWDTDVMSPIEFERSNWANGTRQLALLTGKKQNPHFIDFFVFPRGFYSDVPELVVGRSYWDHWLVWRALDGGLPVLDASRAIVPVHQNHSYGYHPQGKQGTNEDPLAMRNIEVAGGMEHQRTIHDATHAMTKSRRIFRTPARKFLSQIYAMREKQGFLENTFWLRKKLGLRREAVRRLRGIESNEKR
jgi:hypothetical protein